MKKTSKEQKETPAIDNKELILALEELEKEISVDIDHGFTHTIDWILENLFVVDCECPVARNKEGRVVKLLSWNEDDYIVDDDGNKIEQ
mgnify:CR=1 FL=1